MLGAHVLEQLAGMAQLLAAKDDDERGALMAQLDRDSEAARADILASIKQTKET